MPSAPNAHPANPRRRRPAGWAGLVVHGCIRDVEGLAALPIGVKALEANPMKPGKGQPGGQRDVPVVVGGAAIKPGDWLYADPGARGGHSCGAWVALEGTSGGCRDSKWRVRARWQHTAGRRVTAGRPLPRPQRPPTAADGVLVSPTELQLPTEQELEAIREQYFASILGPPAS